MRLGDVDKLLYHKRKVMFFGLVPDDECWGFAVPVEEIDKAPTIDAVPVVRCRECDNHSEVDGLHYCKFWRMYCPNDSEFFCKAGQRKEDTHEVSE